MARLDWDKARREQIVKTHGTVRVDDESAKQRDAQRESAKQQAKKARVRRDGEKKKTKKLAALKARPLPPASELLAREKARRKRSQEAAERRKAQVPTPKKGRHTKVRKGRKAQ
jgi:hypothetical protein